MLEDERDGALSKKTCSIGRPTLLMTRRKRKIGQEKNNVFVLPFRKILLVVQQR